MLLCGRCKKLKDELQFDKNASVKHRGYSYSCKECYYEYRSVLRRGSDKEKAVNKRYIQANRDKVNQRLRKYYLNNKYKVQAKLAVKKAIISGELVRRPCEKCGSENKIMAHHEDYSKHLDIIWLCHLCHARRHRELKLSNASSF